MGAGETSSSAGLRDDSAAVPTSTALNALVAARMMNSAR